MKMIWAVIRPEVALRVIRSLDTAGIGGMTRIDVTGHSRETGMNTGAVRCTEVAQEMLMIVVPDNEVPKAVTIIRAEAKIRSKNATGNGATDDGKIVVTYVEDAFAIRTAGRATRA
jgi:nitrogen regulatory protein PII